MKNTYLAAAIALSLAITQLVPSIALADSTSTAIGVTYEAQVQNKGWEDWASDGSDAGTTGQSLRLEGLKLKLTGNLPAGASIKYQAHVQNIGWQDAVSDGSIAGTEGKSLRIEAIKISLVGLTGYTIKYRTNVQDKGWQDWVSSGEISGTTGEGKRIESLEVKIVKDSTNTNTPTSLDTITLNKLTSPNNDDFNSSNAKGTWYIDYTAYDSNGNQTTNYDLINAGVIGISFGGSYLTLSSGTTNGIAQDPNDKTKAIIPIKLTSDAANIKADTQIPIIIINTDGKTYTITVTLKKG